MCVFQGVLRILRTNCPLRLKVCVWINHVPEAPAQVDNGSQTHLDHYLLTVFDVLLSMIVLSAAQILHQSSTGTVITPRAVPVNGDQHWLCLCNLPRGVIPLADYLTFSVSPCPPACLVADICLMTMDCMDFLCLCPVGSTSSSTATVSVFSPL